MLVDHIPTGNILGLGNTPTFRGLVPGVVGNIFKLNPLGVVKAITQVPFPPCVNLEIATIKFDQSDGGAWTTGQSKHKIQIEDHFVNVQDVMDMNGCSFKRAKINGVAVPDNTNPITGLKDNCGKDETRYSSAQKVSVRDQKLKNNYQDGFENLFREVKKTKKVSNN